MSKTKSIVILTVLAILIAFFGTACFASGFAIPGTTYDYNSVFDTISKGIDLEGGYYAVLTPEVSEGENASDINLENVITTLRARLDDKGYTEATITIQDVTSLRVEIPNVDNPEDVLELLGSQGVLTFKDSAGVIYLTGDDVKDAKAGYVDGSPVVVMTFTDNGRTKFANATSKISQMTDTSLYIYLGDTEISSPTCSEEIDSNTAEIEGITDYDKAKDIAAVISSGALDINFTISETRQISSQLGENVVKNALIAASIGILLIFVLMIVFYGGMGVAASIALMIYVILYIAVLAIFPGVQLTLPGIAGIILSIGMAVDANVIIFDRIKEEFANGKTLNAAIAVGFKRAFITVFDSNVTTILAAIVLYFLSSGSIKGFAITLFFGILVSMFTAIVVTRLMLKLLLPLTDKKEAFCRLSREVKENV